MSIAATPLFAVLVCASAHAQLSTLPRCLNPVPPPIDVPLCVNELGSIPPATIPAHYLLQPPACGGGLRPLLVLFRGAQNGSGPGTPCGTYPAENDHWGPYVHSNLMQAASSRGWYALAPLGMPGLHYGYEQSNYGYEQAIADVLGSYPIDRDRVYALGFSMGGINELNYAARHLDPESDQGMFAASITLAGNTSLSQIWGLICSSRNPLQALLGLTTCTLTPPTCFCANPAVDPLLCPGSPFNSPLPYQRASALHTDVCPPFAFDAGGSLARNLMHVPMWGRIDPGDTTIPILQQMRELDLLMQGLGHAQWDYAEVPLACPGPQHHCWELHQTIGVFQALNGITLQIPASAQVLVPSDGWYFHFRATRADASLLGDFTWDVGTGTNQLTLAAIVNVAELRVRTADSGTTHHSGLDPDQVLTVEIAPNPSPIDVVLEGYDGNPPSLVIRKVGGGPWQVMIPGTDWVHDPFGETLRLIDPAHAQTATWQVRP